MTDYLQELEGQADALERELERLEEALTGWKRTAAGETSPEEERPASPGEAGERPEAEGGRSAPASLEPDGSAGALIRLREEPSRTAAEPFSFPEEASRPAGALQLPLEEDYLPVGAPQLPPEEDRLPAGAEGAETETERTGGPSGREGTPVPLLAQLLTLESALTGWNGPLAGSGTAAQAPGGGGRLPGGDGPEGNLRRGGGLDGTWRARAGSWNGGWSVQAGLPGAEPSFGRGRQGEIAWDGETDQAQRLDRIFRRDSRRYDSGFFLY